MEAPAACFGERGKSVAGRGTGWSFPGRRERRLMEKVGRAKPPLGPAELASSSNFIEGFSYREKRDRGR